MPDWSSKTYKKRKRVRLQGQILHSDDHTEIQILSSNSKGYIARIRWSIMNTIEPSIHIGSLSVIPKWRNKGIATRLIHDAALLMKNSFSSNLFVTVDDVSEQSGKECNVYRNCGFEYGDSPPTMISSPQIMIEKSTKSWKSKQKSKSSSRSTGLISHKKNFFCYK